MLDARKAARPLGPATADQAALSHRMHPSTCCQCARLAVQGPASEQEICSASTGSSGAGGTCSLILDGVLPDKISPEGMCLNAAFDAGTPNMCPPGAPSAPLLLLLCWSS